MSVVRGVLLALAALCYLALPSTALGNDNPKVLLKTSMGDITIELFPEQAPITVDNFLHYVNTGFYNGTVFHRVIRGFAIQTGGYNEDLQKKSADRPPIKNESSNRLKNDRYTVAMARTDDPDSATSQFYINMGINWKLNYRLNEPGYTVFGQVIDGHQVAKRISITKTENLDDEFADLPKKNIVLQEAKLITAP